VFVKEGDAITKDQPVIELENEKAVATIPSTASGTVTKVLVKAGDKVGVGQTLISISGKWRGGCACQTRACRPSASEAKSCARSRGRRD